MVLAKRRTLVAAVEPREAAFEDEVLAKPVYAVFLNDRVAWFYDGCAAERCLAGLDSCYGATALGVWVTRSPPDYAHCSSPDTAPCQPPKSIDGNRRPVAGQPAAVARHQPGAATLDAVSYTHLTLPTIYSV